MKNLNKTTEINWKADSLNVIRAKQELRKFLETQQEYKDKGISTPRTDAYNERRISELTNYIQMNKFTSGEWFVLQQCDANEYCLMVLKELSPEKVNWVFSFKQNGEMPIEEQLANVKLIAAAPLMLKALEGVLHHNNGVKEEYKLNPSLIKQIEAAIKKTE